MKKETTEIPNEVTMAAFREMELMEKDPNRKLYTDMDELMRDLNSDVDDRSNMQDYRGRDLWICGYPVDYLGISAGSAENTG